MQLVHEILRSHDRVEPRHFVFFFFFFFFSPCSMHERLAFVYRDFSTRLSNLSLSFLLFLFLLPIHANGVARMEGRAKEGRRAEAERKRGWKKGGCTAQGHDLPQHRAPWQGWAKEGADKEAECGEEREKKRRTAVTRNLLFFLPWLSFQFPIPSREIRN